MRRLRTHAASKKDVGRRAAVPSPSPPCYGETLLPGLSPSVDSSRYFGDLARVSELADEVALKATAREGVWVRVPPRAHGVRDFLKSRSSQPLEELR